MGLFRFVKEAVEDVNIAADSARQARNRRDDGDNRVVEVRRGGGGAEVRVYRAARRGR
ncbi:hypothetical protein ACWEAF_05855 [Streptomyces sp. NPDC005071]